MLGKIYTLLFLFGIAFSLFYQRHYLKESAKEFNAQLMAENAILPAMSAINYYTNSYNNATLVSSFSGNNIVYYSDKHFEARGDLIYSEINDQNKFDSDSSIIIFTEKAFGEIIANNANLTQALFGKNTLKYIKFPENVNINFDGSRALTRNVYFDSLLKTLDTNDLFTIDASYGSLKSVGFFYSMQDGDFILKSQVDGFIKPNMLNHL
jgi:hypothetical protein